MLFTCSNCFNELNIPDAKLPPTPRFKVKCPHCGERVVLDKNAAVPPGGLPDTPPASDPGPDMAPDLRPELQENAMSVLSPPTAAAAPGPQLEPEIFPPGARVVFMALTDQRWLHETQEFFQEMGFYDSRARDALEAVMKLRLNDYQVVLLEDSPTFAPILEELAQWPGLRRRGLNVILIGDQAQSLDPRIAFRKGVNTYLNSHEAERGHELLGMALKAYDEYYRYLHLAQESLA